MPTSGMRAEEDRSGLSDDNGRIDEQTGKMKCRDRENMTGFSLVHAVFGNQT